jgi:hypothetical protein
MKFTDSSKCFLKNDGDLGGELQVNSEGKNKGIRCSFPIPKPHENFLDNEGQGRIITIYQSERLFSKLSSENRRLCWKGAGHHFGSSKVFQALLVCSAPKGARHGFTLVITKIIIILHIFEEFLKESVTD